MAGGWRAVFCVLRLQVGAIDQEDICVAVVVVVKDGDTGPSGLNNVAFRGYSPVNIDYLNSILRSDVFEPGGRGMNGAGRVRFRYLRDGLLSGHGERKECHVNANYQRFRMWFVRPGHRV